MLTLTLFLGFLFLIGLCAILIFFYLRKHTRQETHRTSTILSAIAAKEEDLEAEVDLREVEVHRHWFYRISGSKWILSVVFTMALVFLATFEFWIPYFPEPVPGTPYPITIRTAYDFQDSGHLLKAAKGIHPQESSRVITRGKVVDAGDIRRIHNYRAQWTPPPPTVILGFFVLGMLFVLFMVYWLSQLSAEFVQDETRNLVFLLLLLLLVVSSSKAVQLTDIFPIYITPVPMIGVLVTILISNRIVPSVVIFANFFIEMLTGFDTLPMLILFAGGMVTVFLSQRIKKRSEVIATGLIAGIIQFVLYNSLLLVGKEIPFREFADAQKFLSPNALACLAGGLASGFLATFLIPLFEKVFGYTSPFRLQELADMDSEILRQLYLKAPGTYHHSLAVSNLGEIAANEIGADALLVRVAGYYHDIGKIFRPKYFVENIPPGEANPHEGIKPYMSAKILKAHISQGLDLGRRYKLPRKILDFIPQHHGTALIDYFFEKAKNTTDPTSTSPGILDAKYYSYMGPRPRTRETTILMIVDSVEAAARVLADHSEETLRKAIEKIITHKLELGQFDESPLTTAEMRKIVYALAKALSSSSHKRIDYPKNSGIHAQFHEEVQSNGTAEDPPPQAAPTPGISVSGAPFALPPREVTGPLTLPRKDQTLPGVVPNGKTKKSEKGTEKPHGS